MQSIKVESNIVIGFHNGAALPAGNIEIDQVMADTLRALKASAAGTGRRILWNDGAPSLEADSRPEITITINGSASNVRLLVNTSFLMEISTVNSFGGSRVLDLFGRRFLFDFTDGAASKNITIDKSAIYPLTSTAEYNLLAPITIDIVE